MSTLVVSRPTSLFRSSSITAPDRYSQRSSCSGSFLIPATTLPKHFNVPFAIQHGYFRCIRYLLQLRYDPNERDSQLRTPLVLCAYVDNDRWSLSLAQNLLEKGARIALEDHARRNALHHACALQRVPLVKIYLSCLDFNIEAKDCEGNTCLHYAAITGNCEIAELLMRAAEKVGIRLDQCNNREGCSAAVLALKYGHIECANQISHRDADEFFVVPRPLSIYEILPNNDDNQTVSSGTTSSKKRTNIASSHLLMKRSQAHPIAALSFGLLKIIFNDSDTGYSTRLADLCHEDKQTHAHRRHKDRTGEAPQTSAVTINKLDRGKSTVLNSARYGSTEALVNETQSSHLAKEQQTTTRRLHGDLSPLIEASPRIQLLNQQSPFQKSNPSFIQKTTSRIHFFPDDMNKTTYTTSKLVESGEIKSKFSIATLYGQNSDSILTPLELEMSKIVSGKLPSKSSTVWQNPAVHPSRPISSKTKPAAPTLVGSSKKKPGPIERIHSTSNLSRTHHSFQETDISNGTRSLSVMGRNHPSSRFGDTSGSIREATGATSRYNRPEALFGLRPADLFGLDEHQPKILDRRASIHLPDQERSKRDSRNKTSHRWEKDMTKIIDLYNVHHSPNYRKSAVPPTTSATRTSNQQDTLTELAPRQRRSSITKPASVVSKSSANSKPSTLASLNISRRSSVIRPSAKASN